MGFLPKIYINQADTEVAVTFSRRTQKDKQNIITVSKYGFKTT